jgi:hypothetical protein
MIEEKDDLEGGSAGDEKYDADRSPLFQLIGHCVTSYQSVEDYLPDLFWAGIGGDEEQNRAIFSAVRGIETMLALIDAALLLRNEDRLKEWKVLRRRLVDASLERGQIAHSATDLRRARHRYRLTQRRRG